MVFSEKKRNLLRLNEIAGVLIKYGFGSVAGKITNTNTLFLSSSTDGEDEYNGNTNVRIRLVLQELGTTFIKLGQTLSTYPDLIGYDLSVELSKLQESAPIDDYEYIESLIESEFSKSVDDIFDDFEQTPFASASIGQVHKAVISGKNVAVKIQHKNVIKTVKSDIQIMRILAKRLKKVSALKSFNLDGLVDVFEKDMKKELDYNYEAMNMLHLSHLLDDDDIYIPEPYTEYTTDKVLTMEYLNGVSLNTVISASDDKYDKKSIAYQGADSFVKQILIHGFFHADPHPGNIFVICRDRLAFVDFGMVGHLDNELRGNLAKLFILLTEGDAGLITKQLYYMGIIPDNDHLKDIEYEIMNILDKYYGKEFNNVSVILRGIVQDDLLNQFDMQIPRDLMVVIRTLCMIDDVGKALYPEFNTTEVLKPYALKMLLNTAKPKNISNKLTERYIDLQHISKKIPESLNNFFDVFDDGRVRISLEYDGIEALNSIITRIVNEVVLAIIIAALLVGSSLIMLTDGVVTLMGYPVLGFLGFSFSAVLGVILIISIIRSGNYL
ncbi:MAG: hypothetical protein BZ136_06100 [Methanosphaera sp. rholeuAM74]|nr:MAG: hypothetical protein BZ136_06100 [Methanosphaera sp. rholeuAM74]